jgi:hypothetical protein
MKRLESQGETLTFQISMRERLLLMQALHRYPMVSPSHHRISRTQSSDMAEAQELLDEALAEQRLTLKSRIAALFTDGQCLKTGPDGCVLTLTLAQRELLLQCLNDIRVGCWTALGCPEEIQRNSAPHTDVNIKHLMMMDLCAYFQHGLIHGNVGD